MGGRYKYVFWGALVIAAIATFGAYRYLQANSGPAKVLTKQVVIANADIPEGAAIDRAQVISCLPSTRGVQIVVDSPEDEF